MKDARAATHEWRWTHAHADQRPLVVKLIRGSAQVVRRPGPITVIMRTPALSAGLHVGRFEVDEDERMITVRDLHPRGSRLSWNECLRQTPHRRNLAARHEPVYAVIYVPNNVPVKVDVMEQRALPSALPGWEQLPRLSALQRYYGLASLAPCAGLEVSAGWTASSAPHK